MPRIPEPSSSERKVRTIIIAIILVMSCAFFARYAYFFFSTQFSNNDFLVFWSAARYLQNGTLEGAYDPTAFYAFQRSLNANYPVGLPFVYPPHAALLLLPFAHLSIYPALIAWDLLSLTVYLAGGWFMFKPRTPLTLAALIAPSTVSNLMFGQTGLLTGGLTMLGFSLLKRRPVASGVAFGLLSIKPQLAALPLLVLLMSGNHRAGKAAVITILLLLLASLGVFHPGDWSVWLQTLTGFSTQFSASPWHYQHGVTAYLTLLDLGINRYAAIAIQCLVSLLVLRQVMSVIRQDSGPLTIMVALIGVFLATPYAMIYDLPVISAVCLMMIAEGTRSSFRHGELLVIAAAWYLPVMIIASGGGNPALALSVFVGLFGLILRRIKAPALQLPGAAAGGTTTVPL
jgi:hypothetical protein